jgi:hypothetical protein
MLTSGIAPRFQLVAQYSSGFRLRAESATSILAPCLKTWQIVDFGLVASVNYILVTPRPNPMF